MLVTGSVLVRIACVGESFLYGVIYFLTVVVLALAFAPAPSVLLIFLGAAACRKNRVSLIAQESTHQGA
jgi:hypothetical protein